MMSDRERKLRNYVRNMRNYIRSPMEKGGLAHQLTKQFFYEVGKIPDKGDLKQDFLSLSEKRRYLENVFPSDEEKQGKHESMVQELETLLAQLAQVCEVELAEEKEKNV